MSPLDSHWELRFSNPKKGPKSEETTPSIIRRLALGVLYTVHTSKTKARNAVRIKVPSISKL